MDDMSNLTVRHGAYYVRFIIPKDRWADAGRALKSGTGQRKDMLRSLQTRDRRTALRLRDAALNAIRLELNAKLCAIGLPPLHGHDAPDWMRDEVLVSEALEARQTLAKHSDEPDDYDELHGPESPRDRVLVGLDAHLDHRAYELDRQGRDGDAYQVRFRSIALGDAYPVGTALDRWTSEREKTVSASYVALDRTAFRLLASFVCESKLACQNAGSTLGELCSLDKSASLDRLRTMTLQQLHPQLLGEFPEWLMEHEGLSPKTVSCRVSSLKSFWDWCIRKHIISGSNPWDGATTGLKKRASREERGQPKRREFTEDELVRLLSADPDEGRRWAWGAAIRDLMRLSLLTGARENELCSLTVDRIMNRDKAKGELWGLSVTDEEAKTANSVRCVPLHPLVRPIIERRLSAALEKGELDAPLFPECKPGGPGMKRGYYFAKRFTDFRRSVLGRASDGYTSFHSFRKSFATFMNRASVAGVSECNLSVTQKLMGHAPQTLTEAVYMERDMEWPVYERAITEMVEKGMPQRVREVLILQAQLS